MATATFPRCANPCPLCTEAACRDAACSAADLDAIPDEIDLLQVMWAHVRSACGEGRPASQCRPR
ncbi:hypothetical protein [Zoogloea sp.]|jgi:hypothetical protein|uniref:hypothetical protein n=1 Tax=Zoogloea sp. TaxID=49181 RepID=UPI0037DA5A6A